MSYQQVNPHSNITFPTTEVPEPVPRAESKTFAEKKEARSEDYAEDAKTSAQTGHDTENQLSSNLITVTLAFVALIAAAISSSDVLSMLSVGQKWLVLIALIIFCISIMMGLTNYFYNMRFHQKSSEANDAIARQANKARSNADLERLERAEVAVKHSGVSRNVALLLAQIISMVVGLLLIVAFVGTLLFQV